MERVGRVPEETEAIEPIARPAPDPFRPLLPDRKPERRDSAPAPAAADGRGAVHTVSAGDTLAGIAIRYGVSQEALKRANRLWTPQELHSRRTLVIPSSAPVSEETRQRATEQFVEVTGCSDVAAAQRLLATHAWRVDSAVTAYLQRPRTASAAALPSHSAQLRLERAEAEAYGDL